MVNNSLDKGHESPEMTEGLELEFNNVSDDNDEDTIGIYESIDSESPSTSLESNFSFHVIPDYNEEHGLNLFSSSSQTMDFIEDTLNLTTIYSSSFGSTSSEERDDETGNEIVYLGRQYNFINNRDKYYRVIPGLEINIAINLFGTCYLKPIIKNFRIDDFERFVSAFNLRSNDMFLRQETRNEFGKKLIDLLLDELNSKHSASDRFWQAYLHVLSVGITYKFLQYSDLYVAKDKPTEYIERISSIPSQDVVQQLPALDQVFANNTSMLSHFILKHFHSIRCFEKMVNWADISEVFKSIYVSTSACRSLSISKTQATKKVPTRTNGALNILLQHYAGCKPLDASQIKLPTESKNMLFTTPNRDKEQESVKRSINFITPDDHGYHSESSIDEPILKRGRIYASVTP